VGLTRTEVEILLNAKNMASRELEGVTADLQRLGAAGRETSEVFLTRVQEDVKTATADFKAGIISVDDYRVAMQHARTEALKFRTGTQLTGKDLATFSTIMDQTATHAAKGGKNTRSLVSGMVSLGAAASGARGPLGEVARLALLMGTGGLVAASLAAGLAGATALYNAWTREARETKKAHEELYATIEEGARAIIPEAIRREQQRQELDRIGAALSEKRVKIEREIADLRAGGAGQASIEEAEERLNALQQDGIDLAIKRNQLRRIAADEQRQDFETRRDALLLEIDLVGKTEDAQRRIRLEHEKFSPLQIAELERLRQMRIEAERISRIPVGFTPGVVNTLPSVTPAELRLRGINPGEIKPERAASLPDGLEFSPQSFGEAFGNDVFEGIRAANNELDSFGATLGGVIAQGFQLQDAFLDAFVAVREGSKSVGKAFGEAIQQGVAQAAAAKGAFYLQESIAAFATGLLGDPKGFLASAKFAAAAAGMFALASLSAGGTHLGGGGRSGGGGGGGDARATEAARERQPLTLVFKGDIPALAPDFVDKIAAAFGEATSRNVIVIKEQ
jgi:hypothetical protein